MELSELGQDRELSRAMARLGLDEELERITAGVDALEEKLDAIAVTEVSPDRLVKVTVDGRLTVRELALDPGIYEKQDAEALSASILATIRQAAATADARATALCEGTKEDLSDA